MKCPKCGYNSFEYLDNCKKCGGSQVAFKEGLGIRPIILAPVPVSAVSDISAEENSIPPQIVPDPESADQIFQWDPPEEKERAAAGLGEPFPDFSLNIDEEPPLEEPEQPQTAIQDPFDFACEEKSESHAEEMSNNPEEASIFGDFTFDEPETSLPETSVTTAGIADSEPFQVESEETAADPFATAEFSLDSFDRLPGEQGAGEASVQSASPGEFDLDSFLSMDIETPPPVDTAAAKSASEDTQLNRDEFDALFGDLDLENKP